MSRSITNQRARLWHRDPRCYWCKRHTRLLIVDGAAPDDMATIDHLFSRLDEKRKEVNFGILRKDYTGETMVMRRVLACYACNQERGRRECKLTKLREQRASSIAGGSNTKRRDGRALYECSYPERSHRLKKLKQRAERDVFGLISVMGLPLKGGIVSV